MFIDPELVHKYEREVNKQEAIRKGIDAVGLWRCSGILAYIYYYSVSVDILATELILAFPRWLS